MNTSLARVLLIISFSIYNKALSKSKFLKVMLESVDFFPMQSGDSLPVVWST